MVDHCIIRDNVSYGIELATNIREVNLDGCLIEDGSAEGIFIGRDAANVTIRNSQIRMNNSWGVRLAEAHNVIVSGCEILDNGAVGGVGGIWVGDFVTGCENVNINNNVIGNHDTLDQDIGVKVDAGAIDPMIYDNQFVLVQTDALDVAAGVKFPRISGNRT